MSQQLEQRAQEIAAEHAHDVLRLALHLAAHENEIRRLKQAWSDEIEAVKAHKDKIKADAVRDAFLEAKIPSRAKAGCIGEFSINIENGQVCPECYWNEDSPECEICHGESIDGLSDLTVDIPWMTQKEIFKSFCKFAAQDYANKLEATKENQQ
jgi:hypothetical protein